MIPVCFYKHPLSDPRVTTIGGFSIATLLFSLALNLMRLRIVDWKEVKKELFSLIDLIIIVSSLLEIATFSLLQRRAIIPSTFVGVFLIKLVIQFKSIRSSSSFKDYYATYSKIAKQMKQLIIFILLLIMIYSLIGMRLYSPISKDPDNEILRRNSFANFPRAFLACFTIITGETWAKVYYEFKRKVDTTSTTVYFFTLFFFVSFIFLNFLLSIILNTISEASRRIETKSQMKKFRNIEPSVETIILNDYIDFLSKKTLAAIRIKSNKVIPAKKDQGKNFLTSKIDESALEKSSALL